MAVLRYLNVELKLLADNFNNGLKAAQKEAKEFEKTIRPSKELAKELGLAMSAAGLAVVGSMTAMAKAAANYGDDLAKASQRTGATVQELAKLRFAAEQSGASFEDVSTGLRVLSKNAEEARKGTGAQAEAFRTLGIQVLDSSGKIKPLNSLLLEVADKFAVMEDGAEKAAIAQELFGRGGTALIPTLNEGRKGLEQMGNMAERLGLVISNDAAKASEEFNDTLDQMNLAVSGLGNVIGSVILPSLTRMAAGTRDVIISIKDWAKEHETLTQAIFGTGLAITGAGGIVLGLAAIATVAPKVVLAFQGIKVAAVAATEAIGAFTVLSGAKTYADIAAGITLIGEASLVAKAGLIGLAAAAGIAIGSLVNLGIEALGLQKDFDRLVASVARTIPILGNWATGTNAVIKANNTLEASTQRLSDNLRSQGIIVERGKDSLEQWNLRVINAAKGSDKFQAALAQQKTSQAEVNDTIAYFSSISQGYAKNTGEVLADIYKKQASNAGDHAAEVKRVTEELRQLDKEQKAFVNSGYLEWWKSVNGQMEDAEAQLRRNNAETLKNAKDAVQFEKEKAESVRKINLDVQDDLNDQLRLSNKIALDEIKKQNDARKAAAEEEKRRLRQATEDVKRAAGAVFDDLLIKGENVFSSLRNALKGGALSLGRAMFEDVVGNFLGPVKKAIDDFIKDHILSKLGGAISGVFGSGGANAAGTAAQAAASTGGTAASAGSQVSGGAAAAGGGALSTIGAVAGIAGAAGSIVGAVGTLRLEGTMNAVEYNTRASRIHLEVIINEFMHPFKTSLEWILKHAETHTNELDAIYNVLNSRLTGVPAAAYAGASASPQMVSTVGPTTITINMPVTTSNDPIEFASKVRTVLKSALKTDRDGVRSDVILAASQNRGLASSLPQG